MLMAMLEHSCVMFWGDGGLHSRSRSQLGTELGRSEVVLLNFNTLNN